MDPWYKIATPRKEVREGRSFNPDEFAIALEQVVSGAAPEDYRDPVKFFARTCFTRALREHAGMVLRRLAGKTENTAPVLALITQFGGGKTHTLTALYHLVHHGGRLPDGDAVQPLLDAAGLDKPPAAQVAVFVGNAWDPAPGAETPWIDLARQLAGDKGVAALGPQAREKAPGTANLAKLLAEAGPCLILCDEVLNFLSRHRDRADAFRDFLGNLVRTLTGTTGAAAVISLPQSKPEMSDWDLRWQDIVVKEVNRVAKNLLSNDEAEISEVVRRRLFEDLGSERTRKNVAKAYADWCFERRAQLPPEWTAVDTAATEAKAREYLRSRFEACYPFHPATLSVFQRKWQSLAQYQQTRGTLAMLAQWISWAYREGFQQARREPLLTLGSAPLDNPDFRSTVLSQLGEPRLAAAIDTDIAGERSHAHALDADTAGPLRDIHRRVGAAILFESSGGQVDRVARLPELRFALGEPDLDTTSIDNAAHALESKAFYLSPVGTDGFKVYHKATIRKAVSDRRASLDEENEVKPALRAVVKKEFEKGPRYPLEPFPEDPAAIPDSPKLTLVLMDPTQEWTEDGALRPQIAEWTRRRGKSDRLYPGALVWCLKKPGRDLRDKVELWLAWKRVSREVQEGSLGADYDRADLAEIRAEVEQAEEEAQDEVWAGYRFVVLADAQESDGLKAVDLGAGHSSGSETLWARIVGALKSQALLNESVGAGYLERNWPPALKTSGAWPLASVRQSFLNGALTRLLDVDTVLQRKVVEFVKDGDFGLASGPTSEGGYERLWFAEPVRAEEVAFEPGVFLLTKARAKALKEEATKPTPPEKPPITPKKEDGVPEPDVPLPPQARVLHLTGEVPPAVWNRMGTVLIPKLRSGSELKLGIDFTVTMGAELAQASEKEIRQTLEDLGLKDKVRIE
jgi:hypothetical protein